jgi:hypothetical protein
LRIEEMSRNGLSRDFNPQFAVRNPQSPSV